MPTPEEVADEMIGRHAKLFGRGEFRWPELKTEIIAAIKAGPGNRPAGAEAFDRDGDGKVGGSMSRGMMEREKNPYFAQEFVTQAAKQEAEAPTPAEPRQPFTDDVQRMHPLNKQPEPATVAKPAEMKPATSQSSKPGAVSQPIPKRTPHK